LRSSRDGTKVWLNKEVSDPVVKLSDCLFVIVATVLGSITNVLGYNEKMADKDKYNTKSRQKMAVYCIVQKISDAPSLLY
jgi:hypothetical protein